MSTTKKQENDAEKQALVVRKRKRASYGLDVKLHVIKQKKENGQRVVDIARALGIPETTIRTMLKNSAEIEAKATTTPRHSEANITRMRSNVMEIMERQLCLWIEDLYQQNTPVSLSLIRTKALSLYDDIQKEIGEDSSKKKSKEFSASKGWFHRFQKRYGFKNVKMQQGPASVDLSHSSPDKYSDNLKKFIDDEGAYDPKQIFNEPAGLYGKRISSRTYVSKKKNDKSSFKFSLKDKVSDDKFLEAVNDDVDRLLDSHSLPLTNEHLAALNQATIAEEEEGTIDDVATSKKGFTVDNLQTVFSKIAEVVEFFKEHDHQSDRADKFERGLNELLSCYRTLLSEKLRDREHVTLSDVFVQQEFANEHQPISGSSDDRPKSK